MIADSHLQTIAALGLAMLRRRLPADWLLEVFEDTASPSIPQEALLAVPGRRRVRIQLHVVRQLVSAEIAGLQVTANRVRSPLLIVAPVLDRGTRDDLTARGMNFVDLSGYMRFSLLRPAVSLDVRGVPGAARPRRKTPVKLSGSNTARLVRTLCDFRPPTDCARVASRADVSTAYATRIVRALADEGVVVMTGGDRIESADWTALLRRWSDDDRARLGQFTWYVAPSGIASVTSRLQNRHDCVVSGPWAANVFAPVASTQVLLCYVRDRRKFAEQLDLAVTDRAADIAVSRHFPDSVMNGTSEYGEIRIAALSQIAADLLTMSLESMARPVLEWMRNNEPTWRR